MGRRVLERRHTSAALSQRNQQGLTGLDLKHAGERSGAGQSDAEHEEDRRDGTIEKAFKSRKLSEGHDKVSFLVNPLG